jgi:hypothetical protein
MKKHYVITERNLLVSFEEIEIVRHITCYRYDDCLNIAAHKKWRSFTCIKCPVFRVHKKQMKTKQETLSHLLEEF